MPAWAFIPGSRGPAIGARCFASATSTAELALPLSLDASDEALPADALATLRRAWKQVNELRAFFFGFTTSASLESLADQGPQDDFWAIYFDLRFTPVVTRFYRFMSCIKPSHGAQASAGALPVVALAAGWREVSARSVMEAYALTIELLNRYFRGIHTDSTTYSEPAVRRPGPLYTVALEHLLEGLPVYKRVTLAAFLGGTAPLDIYYLMAALSFAAMQVPVFQQLDGETEVVGDREALSPAQRFCRLAAAFREGGLPSLPGNIRGQDRRKQILKWLRACHRLAE